MYMIQFLICINRIISRWNT